MINADEPVMISASIPLKVKDKMGIIDSRKRSLFITVLLKKHFRMELNAREKEIEGIYW